VTTIFLDRDGVINENRADYVKSWSEFRFLPGSREAIAKLTQAGHRIVVCSNQAGVARGSISMETVDEIHRRMKNSISEVGGKIEKIYCCPHGRDEDCACRKPRPGMLLRARDELGIDMHDAVFIGDSITDIRAGLAAGIQTVLVLSGLGLEQFREHHLEVNGAFRISMNLKNATELVLKGLHVPSETQSSLERTCYWFHGLRERVDSLLSLEEHDMVEASFAP
jgi:D-glycero-D-manno-heptose 1,7-bisphosphate phosphatase